MELILAVDLMGGRVVHGYKGERSSYRPLDWGIAHSTEPVEYVSEIGPRFLYVADLDRIVGRGSHDAVIEQYARMVERSYVDRGVRSAREYLTMDG
ncbi:MAG TPA: HisA/HisF-related TIM barrel protein, partial [Methanomicrobiales archaeon]|nr:HisA/HisF-related TIM barrel protein [Methanomicrobiales archaeon]